jgi:hypothetical protein
MMPASMGTKELGHGRPEALPKYDKQVSAQKFAAASPCPHRL